jgi:hypothetical protein
LQHDFLGLERPRQRLEIELRERIDQIIVSRDAELYQAKLLVVAVQAVRFRIDRDAIDGSELGKECGELGVCLDHA